MRELLTVKNDEARQFYESTAIEKKWTRDELVKAIQADHFGEDPTKGNGKPPKTTKAAGVVNRSSIGRRSIALLTGILLLVRLDLGFDVWIGLRIRLAEVDAPPIERRRRGGSVGLRSGPIGEGSKDS
jgi:hypothetical protein